MRPIRMMSLAAMGLSLLVACNPEPRGPERVEIPVNTLPPRAMNEEMVEGTFTPRPAATKPAKPTETAVAQTPAAGAEKPTQVAVVEPKREAPPTVKPPEKPKETKPAPSAEPAAKDQAVERARFVNQSDEIVSVLKNGATVIVKRMPSPVVAVRGYVQTGGVYEGQWLGGGLSHLLEHLVAGGSSRKRTEAQNRDLLQRIGNNSNAYTSEDHTAYFVNTTTEHLDEAVDIVTGWMLGALITPQEYKREYEVVQRELEKNKGEPDWVFYMLSQHNRYRVSPARVPVIGYQEVIQSLSRDDVYSYYLQTYQVNNMVFSVTGDLDPEVMLRAVQKQLDDAKPGRVPSRTIEPEPPVLTPRTLVATFPKLGQAKLELAFPSVSLHDPDLYPLDLLSTVLGGGESSLLVEELRDKPQLVTNITAGNPTPSYVEGSFQIQMELSSDNIADATKVTMALLDEVIANGLSEDRIKRAKVQMRTARVRSLQTSEGVAGSLANDFLNTGDPHFTDRYLSRIDQVTGERLKLIAQKYFVKHRMLTTALLPAESAGADSLPKAEDLMRPIAPTTKDSPDAAEKPVVTRVELPNGAILLHKRISTSPLVEVRTFSLGGLTEEDAENNGIGNLAMEMTARGTKTRNAQQIASFFDSIGGTLEAKCGNNSWYWNTTCLRDDFEKSMEVYADVINNASFPDDELVLMKQRVAATIEMQDADWHTQAMRFFKTKYFGPMDSPYQFLAIGTKENVPKFSRDQLEKWYREKVLKARRVVAIFGDVDLEKAKAVATERFGGGEKINTQAPAAGEQPQFEPVAKPSVEIERVEVQKTEQPLAGVVVGYDAASFVGDPVNYPIAIADTMCSGYTYPTGYLHEILRGRGLVYVVHAQNVPGRSADLPGAFLVYAGCDPSKVNEVIDVIVENIARLQGTEKDLQPGWFERSKELCTTADALENESPGAQAQTAAVDELMGLGYDYHDQFKPRIEAVKLKEMTAAASRRLAKCVVTVSTPAPEAVTVKPEKREYRKFPPVDLTPRGVQHDTK